MPPADNADLLALACDAHGGLTRWQATSRIAADVAVGGALWASKGHPAVLADAHVTAYTDRQVLIFDGFGPSRWRSVLEPGRITLQDKNGTIRAERLNPRVSFPDDPRARWDDLQVAYFASYAMWNYLTLPFLATTTGFHCDQVPRWPAADPTWRRLRVEFPAHVATHTAVQHLNIDSEGLVVRHDYDADVLGRPPAANVASGHREFGGIVFATQRRVTPRTPDGAAATEPLLVSIDFGDIQVR
jgi:hypothetical protein